MTDLREPTACPFCGDLAMLNKSICDASVVCVSCGAKIVRNHSPGSFEDGLPDAIAAWNTRAPADGWQGIETAPKDGTEILTYRQAGLMSVATYWPHGKAFWCATDGAHLLHVTHWRPLPAPPQDLQE